MEIRIESKIDKQLAHVMANYADNPDEFMVKMNELVIEWYCKGIEQGILTERKHRSDKSEGSKPESEV